MSRSGGLIEGGQNFKIKNSPLTSQNCPITGSVNRILRDYKV